MQQGFSKQINQKQLRRFIAVIQTHSAHDYEFVDDAITPQVSTYIGVQ